MRDCGEAEKGVEKRLMDESADIMSEMETQSRWEDFWNKAFQRIPSPLTLFI